MPTVSSISFLDPTHVWTPDGSDAIRGRRGPYKAPNGALYAVQTSESAYTGTGTSTIYHGIFKSTNGGVSWAKVAEVSTGNVSGSSQAAEMYAFDFVQCKTATNLMVIVYLADPFTPGPGAPAEQGDQAFLRLKVFDAASDSFAVSSSGDPTVLIGNIGFDPCVMVNPSFDGTTAQVAHTWGGETGGSEETGFITTGFVRIVEWNGSGWSGATTSLAGVENNFELKAMQGLEDGVCCLAILEVDDFGTDTALHTYVIDGLSALDHQSMESDTLNAGIAVGQPSSYDAGSDWKICLPLARLGSASGRFIPAAMIGTYSGGVITWDTPHVFTAVGYRDLQRDQANTPLASCATLSGFVVSWCQVVGGYQDQIGQSTYSGLAWSTPSVVFDTSTGMLDSVNAWSYNSGGTVGTIYIGGFKHIYTTYIDGAVKYLIEPDAFDTDLPNSSYTSLYMPLFASTSGSGRNRWYAF